MKRLDYGCSSWLVLIDVSGKYVVHHSSHLPILHHLPVFYRNSNDGAGVNQLFGNMIGIKGGEWNCHMVDFKISLVLEPEDIFVLKMEENNKEAFAFWNGDEFWPVFRPVAYTLEDLRTTHADEMSADNIKIFKVVIDQEPRSIL